MHTTSTITGPAPTTPAGPARTRRSRSRAARVVAGLAVALVATVTSLGFSGFASPAGAAVAKANCVGRVGSTTVSLGTVSLRSCAIYVRATTFGPNPTVGLWGRQVIATDRTGAVYYYTRTGWRFGFQDSSIRSLADRCRQGNVAACRTWKANSQFAIDSLNRLYPPGSLGR